MKKISLSSGFSRSHLLHTGLLLSEIDRLHTATTPYSTTSHVFNLLLTPDLREKNVDRTMINSRLNATTSIWPEIIFRSSRLMQTVSSSIATNLESKSFLAFREHSRQVFKESKAYEESNILFRAGFGPFQKNVNSFMVCDASLAHPQTLNSLLKDGKFGLQPLRELSPIDQMIVQDCERADKIIVNSDFVRDSFTFAGFPSDKIEVVYLPPLRKFQTWKNSSRSKDGGKFQILFAGTLEMRKGVNLLAEVITDLDSVGLDYKMILVGSWQKNSIPFRKLILSSKNVTWIPWQSHLDLVKVMSESDVLILPTYAEGGARVVTEAMSIGLPVLTTPNAGSPISDGFDGFLLGLSSKEFSSKILELVNNRDSLRHISRNARTTISEKFDEISYIKSILKICQG